MFRYVGITLVLLAGMALTWSCTRPTAKEATVDLTGLTEVPPRPETVVDHPSKLEFAPLEFEPPKAADYRVKLSNGMILYIAQDKELPTFDMKVIVRTGSMYEPAEKAGLGAMCGTLLRKGGTSSMTGEEIDEFMAQLAGSLTTQIGFSSGSVSLSVLKEDAGKGLEMLADVLMNPVFDRDEIRRYKEKTLQELEHRYDHPSTLLHDVYAGLVYGDHPAGRLCTKSSIQSITREDLLSFHGKYFHPDNCIVAVAGDFDRAEMIKKIEKTFADWAAAGTAFPQVPDARKKFKKGLFLLGRDIDQGHIRLGHLGIRADNPDIYAVRVMNAILGGGSFTSRLTTRVRSDEGLTYFIASWFDTPVEYSGTFSCLFQTKSKSVAYALSIVMQEIKRIRTELVSKEELQGAKDLFIERFPSIFSGGGSAAYARVQALAGNEYNRRPLDYFEHYRDNLRKVTRRKVLRMAKKYLNPRRLRILIVGKAQDMKAGDGLHEVKIEDFGDIEQLEPPDLMK